MKKLTIIALAFFLALSAIPAMAGDQADNTSTFQAFSTLPAAQRDTLTPLTDTELAAIEGGDTAIATASNSNSTYQYNYCSFGDCTATARASQSASASGSGSSATNVNAASISQSNYNATYQSARASASVR